MKCTSGILVMKSDSRRSGRATVDFDSFAVTGDATLTHGRRVGGTGRFDRAPAYIVSWREYTLEDTGRSGGSERDEYVLNSTCERDRLVVSWNIGDDAEAFEISFMVIGE